MLRRKNLRCKQLKSFFVTLPPNLGKDRIEVLLLPSSLHSRSLQLRFDQERTAAADVDTWSLDNIVLLAYESEEGKCCS